MKKHITTLLCALLASASLFAQKADNVTADTLNAKKDIVKKGFNFGPLPAVAFS